MLGVRMYAVLEYEEIPTDVDRYGDWLRDERLEPIQEAVGNR